MRLSGLFQVADIEEFLTSFTKDIKSHLQDRFPHSDVLECCFIFDPKSYVDLRYDELPKFGLPELQKLLVHVGKIDLSSKLIDCSDRAMRESLKHEFASMKEALWQRAKRRAGLSMNTVWAEFYEAGGEQSMPCSPS